MTQRLYLADPYRSDCVARVTAAEAGWVALSETVFYPGGGGQPSDTGFLEVLGLRHQITEVRQDERGWVWHRCAADVAGGAIARGCLDWARRYAFMRHHTLLHILNAVVLTDYCGLITGVQIGEEQSRIDFAMREFGREQIPALEARINEVIAGELPIDACVICDAEFRERPDLVRTATVAPPIVDGAVRVVRIIGFDAQACGGTHVRNTRELGGCRILRFENKGKQNKRLYVGLCPSRSGSS
jgi:misacylated tRNA(Ala) deacylase